MTPASRKILERTTHNAEQRASIAARAKAARSSPVYRAAAAARAARTAARTTVPPTAFRDATSARAASQTHPHPGDASIPTPEGAKAAGEDPHAETPLEEPASAMPMDVDREIASGDTEMHFIGSMSTEQGIGRLSPPIDDEVAELLLAQMGASGRQSRRDYGRAARKLVTEIYSPPRVTKLLSKLRSRHMMAGFAFDITVLDPDDGEPWDFNVKAKREKARAMIREQRPYALIGSPMCTAFSTWQRLNASRTRDPAAMERARQGAILHLNFVAELYAEQLEGGRYFLHEHPLHASSWEIPSIARIMAMPNVQRVHGDQCQFGAEIQSGPDQGSPIKKPSGFMTNSPAIAAALDIQCQGQGGACSRPRGGRHGQCSGRHAKDAAIYPRELCRAVLRGIRNQMRADHLLKDGCYGVQAPDDDAEIERNVRGPERGFSGAYRDDLTGQVLKDVLVKEARAKELAFFWSKKVWVKVPRSEAHARGGRRPVSVRWVDVNKGDDLNPNYRSRLVARQLKATDMSGKSYFAPAPPLEALRTVICMAMTRTGDHVPDWNPVSPNRMQISLVDVKRAYFNAAIDPREPATFVELPQEEPDHADMCARLLRHMYGTRAAADGWQEEYSTLLVDLGFKQGDASPNVFRHAKRQITCSVHGDDFTSSGPKSALDWFEAAVAEHYELTISPRMGPGPDDAKEGRVLNRVIRWLDKSIEYECDPRQVERLIAECGLAGEKVKSCATPGVKATFKELEEDSAELAAKLATPFRGAAARGNFLSPDRVDVQFACKEVCRWMSRPSEHAWKALKRVCRFLAGAPRLVYVFEQQTVDAIDIYTDTDWAGCPLTRKSTSGGCVMMGKHAIKHWSSTQTSISLSSGEAEFAGVIRGAGQGLGYQALLRDVGVELPLRVWTDSSAAIGICSRQGLGKFRHLDTHTLWIQQAVRTKRVDLRKVPGESNPADILTKHSISRQKLEELIALYGCKYIGGRAASAPLMREGGSSKETMATAGGEISGVESPAPADMHEAGTALETSPSMPHLEYSGIELDRLFPSIPPPEDDKLDDLVDDRADVVYQKGLRISEQITAETSAQGRRRRPTLSTLRRPKGDAPDIGRRRSTNDVQARRSLWTAMTTHDNDAQVPRDLCAIDTLPRATTTASPYTGSTTDPATPCTTNSLLLGAPSLASQVPAAPWRLLRAISQDKAGTAAPKETANKETADEETSDKEPKTKAPQHKPRRRARPRRALRPLAGGVPELGLSGAAGAPLRAYRLLLRGLKPLSTHCAPPAPRHSFDLRFPSH